jgi:hypothetical protein
MVYRCTCMYLDQFAHKPCAKLLIDRLVSTYHLEEKYFVTCSDYISVTGAMLLLRTSLWEIDVGFHFFFRMAFPFVLELHADSFPCTHPSVRSASQLFYLCRLCVHTVIDTTICVNLAMIGTKTQISKRPCDRALYGTPNKLGEQIVRLSQVCH